MNQPAGMRVAGAGFLLAVLWFDLMFDVQALGSGTGPLPEPVLASIAAYYRRVTTDAAPMGWLVGLVMLATIVSAGLGVVRDHARRGERLIALVLVTAAVAMALARVFPNAVALGARTATPEVQSVLARAILRDHLVCLVAIAGFLGLEFRLLRRSTAAPRS